MMKVCVITKMYVTARGGRGVCYTIGGKKAATFMPADLEGMDQVRAWLSESLGVPVKPAHEAPRDLRGARLPGASEPLARRWLQAMVYERAAREHLMQAAWRSE